MRTRERWMRAAGHFHIQNPEPQLPRWTPFHELRARGKWELLHGLAASAADDGYVTAYAEADINAVVAAKECASLLVSILPTR